MRKLNRRLLSLVVVLFAANAASAGELKIGAAAPHLCEVEWVLGGEQWAAPEEGTAAVAFLSATAPNRAETFRQLVRTVEQLDGVKIAGIVRGDGAACVDELGEIPEGLSIGMDAAGSTWRDWMEAARLRAAPTAFLIKRGCVVWMGALEALAGAVAFVPEPPELDRGRFPRDEVALLLEYAERVLERKSDETERREFAEEIRRRAPTDVLEMKHLAMNIVRDITVYHRDSELAVYLIDRALELGGQKEEELLDLKAEACFLMGDAAAAVEAGRQALEMAPENLEYAIRLERYEGAADEAAGLQLRTPRFGLTAVAAGTNVYVLGGWWSLTERARDERFHAGSAWTETVKTGLMARRFHVAGVHGGKVYVTGGLRNYSSDEEPEALEEYDPATGECKILADLPELVLRAGGVVLDDSFYVVGGALIAQKGVSAGVQIYDFASGKWRRGADMPVAREGQVFAHEGRIYAPGGYDGGKAIRDFQVYDPAQDQWSQLPLLPVKASAFQGAVLGGRLYLFGDFDELNRVVAYDFVTGEWSRLKLPYRPARHGTAVVLGDEIFVIGGNIHAAPPYRAGIQRFSSDELGNASSEPWGLVISSCTGQ